MKLQPINQFARLNYAIDSKQKINYITPTSSNPNRIILISHSLGGTENWWAPKEKKWWIKKRKTKKPRQKIREKMWKRAELWPEDATWSCGQRVWFCLLSHCRKLQVVSGLAAFGNGHYRGLMTPLVRGMQRYTRSTV